MNKLKINKILLSSILSVGILASSAMPVFADSYGGNIKEETSSTGSVITSTKKDSEDRAYGASGSELNFEVESTNVNVTVPTSVPFIFNRDGDTLVPNNFIIENNSKIAGIYLENITLDSKKEGWKVVDENFDLTTMGVDAKNVRIKFGKKGEGEVMKFIEPSGIRSAGVSRVGSASFDNSEINIQATKTQKLDFEIERGAFSKDEASSKAFDMTLQFRFQ